MSWNNIIWGEFLIEDLFNVKIGKNIDGNKVDKKSGKFAYITRKESSNGLDGFINFEESFLNKDYPVITIGNETAEPFVQDFSFFTGTKVNILIPKKVLSSTVLFFISTSLKAHKSKYSYSFTINSTRLKRQKILLPVNSMGEPDYDFMESYMKQKEAEFLEKYKKYISLKISNLKFMGGNIAAKQSWKEFKLSELFSFVKGDQNNMANITSGFIPLVSAKKTDNGYKNFALQSKKLYQGNTLTLNNDGDGGAGISYYQPTFYLLDSHVTALYPKRNLDKYILLYISRCITVQRGKFGHGYSINSHRLKVFKLMLPINSKGEPDYIFMQNYIKKLEYKKLKGYLEYKLL